MTEEQWQDILNMGISVCEKSGNVLAINANIFASYVASKYLFIFTKESFYNYKYDLGKWRKVEDLKMRANLRKILHTYYNDIWSKRLEDEYIEALKRTVLYEGELNSNNRYINMINGMYDLEEHIIVEHNPNFYSTIQIPTEYDPNAKCPNFEKFLNESFLGDDESKLLAQEWAGYSMTAETKAQKFLLLYGTGANGKGVYTDLLSECIGEENISHVSLTEINKPFMRVCLHNKLANICSENESNGASINTQYLKMLTGEDSVNAEEKYKPSFTFKSTAKIILSTNNLPHTKDTSNGYRRRISILHFRNTLDESKRDRNLKDKLKKELPGVFNFAMEGLKRLRANNFQFSDCSVSNEVLKEYEKDINPMISFFEECIREDDESNRVDKKIIYNTFRVWAEAHGMKGYADISSRRFWARFEEQYKSSGYKGKAGRSNTFRYYTGVKVISEYRVNVDNPVFTGTYVLKGPLGR